MSENLRFRAILRLAATWGVALSALATSSLALGLATGLVPSGVFGPREFVGLAVRGMLAGAVTGGLFGWLLSSRERGQSLSTLSYRRVALWSFLAAGSVTAGIVVTAGAHIIPMGVLAAGAMGAGLGGSVVAVGLLRVARREPERLNGAPDNASRLLP